jgi:CubicO group peptidase (beta-lactamase class C family)
MRSRGDGTTRVERELDRGVRRRAGLVIGVLAPDGRDVHGRSADGSALGGRSVFEIGSITKTYTALLLADGVVRGDWSLGTPVRELLPADVRVPSRDGVEITLEHLATHRSGLPGSPLPVVAGSLDMLRGVDPYAGLTADGLLEALADARVRRTPGTGPVHYSNLGVGVLGQAMAHATGSSYADLLAERVLRPLGLEDTGTDDQLDADQRARLVQGHRARGRPAPAWPLVGLPAAGALRSTADDVLRYLAAQLRPEGTPLAEAIRLTQVVRELPIGLGWMRYDKPKRVWWHNGGTGGFRSFAGFRPETGHAVVVLANQSRSVDLVGLRVLRSLD